MPDQPTIVPGPGTEKPLAQVGLADIVRLKVPYQPHREFSSPGSRGSYQFGIVAEILTVLPDGRVRNVSLYLYDPDSRTIYLGPNNVPEFVDFHTSELELYKRAAEQGYMPLV
jgi:hypothetical protein